MIDNVLGNLPVFILVFARMTGMFSFNPVLSRRNLPVRARVGLILALTLLLAPTMSAAPIVDYRALELAIAILRELAIGAACGFVFQIFYYLIFFVGDMMDMQFGMSMAKVFDPGTNIQMPATGNLISLLLMVYIFVTNSHLLMINIFATSYDILPIGAGAITAEFAGFVLDLFLAAFSLIMRLGLPFIAAEFILEMSMGVLMKLIPQIHVFVINIQFKLLLGLCMLLALSHPMSEFIDSYMSSMFISIEKLLYAFAG